MRSSEFFRARLQPCAAASSARETRWWPSTSPRQKKIEKLNQYIVRGGLDALKNAAKGFIPVYQQPALVIARYGHFGQPGKRSFGRRQIFPDQVSGNGLFLNLIYIMMNILILRTAKQHIALEFIAS